MSAISRECTPHFRHRFPGTSTQPGPTDPPPRSTVMFDFPHRLPSLARLRAVIFFGALVSLPLVARAQDPGPADRGQPADAPRDGKRAAVSSSTRHPLDPLEPAEIERAV